MLRPLHSSLAALLGCVLLMPTISGHPHSPTKSAQTSAEKRWFKGNLHTHSLWSDGDDYPEMVAMWYKEQGYHFLAISDHNVMHEGVRWLELKPATHFAGVLRERGGGEVLQKYLRRFGSDWVEQREIDGMKEVRLKPLSEYRALVEEPGRFLLIPSEEVSSKWTRPATGNEPEKWGPIHVNATNLRNHIPRVVGSSALEVMQESVDAVLAQRTATGQSMFPQINHPNFRWGVTAEDLMMLKGARFFEVYNGHPTVNNEGDAFHLDTDKMWDAILAHRLTVLGLDVMYGVAVDDSHDYHTTGIGHSNAGRGWIMVRASRLTPESIVHAMESGEFYASTGVTLNEILRDDREITVAVAGERGVTYVTQFLGTRIGFDSSSELIAPPDDSGPTLPHRRYSEDIGAILAEVEGTTATYALQGDEIYVRAKIISSKLSANPGVPDEKETAWTQPFVIIPRTKY